MIVTEYQSKIHKHIVNMFCMHEIYHCVREPLEAGQGGDGSDLSKSACECLAWCWLLTFFTACLKSTSSTLALLCHIMRGHNSKWVCSNTPLKKTIAINCGFPQSIVNTDPNIICIQRRNTEHVHFISPCMESGRRCPFCSFWRPRVGCPCRWRPAPRCHGSSKRWH